MAATFAPARQVFAEVDDALSQNLSRLMFEGPEGELTLTDNAQPALLAASLLAIAWSVRVCVGPCCPVEKATSG